MCLRDMEKEMVNTLNPYADVAAGDTRDQELVQLVKRGQSGGARRAMATKLGLAEVSWKAAGKNSMCPTSSPNIASPLICP